MNGIVNRRIRLYLALGGIFICVLILNLLNYPFLGDDYVYAFMWQGKDIFTPLPEGARRIQSFSDIFQSLYSHYFTWGGRMVAHFFVMLFMWVGKFWFDIANSFMVVLLLLEMQWIAHEGRITMDIRAGHVALAFFCLWAFNFDWCHTIIWLAGACNYLWAMVLLLLFLIPYIRHYFTNGEVEYGSWLVPVMFFLGLAAGDTNENTICWIGLTGILYLWKCYRNKAIKPWMIAGFIGLSLGYGLLILAPGNFIRSEDDYNTDLLTKIVIFWAAFLMQNVMWFYLLKAYQWGKNTRNVYPDIPQYLHVGLWFAITGILFNLIMFLSPAFFLRSIFPSHIFVITGTVVILYISRKRKSVIIQKRLTLAAYGLAVLYFCFTYPMTLYSYHIFYRAMGQVIEEADLLQGQNKDLIIHNYPDPREWSLITGYHVIFSEFVSNKANWRNVAFARYYRIQGVKTDFPDRS
ncbi:DUF6056 family protein [uncultured Dialister sp.]|uniref:DUF3329 domain-containing protein n=1 Tax=uncultured Dialister sp. TaxID=278064 RepID=UPI002591FD5B|nr:DUF6056 family protein [uncultured Dialister sp.]